MARGVAPDGRLQTMICPPKRLFFLQDSRELGIIRGGSRVRICFLASGLQSKFEPSC